MNENKVYSASVEGIQPVSFVIPLEKCCNRFAIGDGLSVNIMEWNGKDSKVKIVKELFNVKKFEHNAANFWSIAKPSPNCDLFGGTFRGNMCGGNGSSIGNGGFYKYSKCCGATQLFDDQGLSAGFDWNLNKNLFYHIDTCKFELQEFDWDPKMGKIRELNIELVIVNVNLTLYLVWKRV